MQSKLPAGAAAYDRPGHSPTARSIDDRNESTKSLALRTGRKIKEGLRHVFYFSEKASEQTIDHRLLVEVAQGRSAAFALLYDRLSGPLYSMCLRMTGDASRAEEILQAAFLTVWQRAKSYDPALSTVFSWAVHLTRCQAIYHLRSCGRRLSVPAPPSDDGADDPVLPSPLPTQAEAPLRVPDDSGRHGFAGQVRRVLDAMPDQQRQAIELAFFSDLSHHEISARLKQPLGAIKAHLRRGLLDLRDGLESSS